MIRRAHRIRMHAMLARQSSNTGEFLTGRQILTQDGQDHLASKLFAYRQRTFLGDPEPHCPYLIAVTFLGDPESHSRPTPDGLSQMIADRAVRTVCSRATVR